MRTRVLRLCLLLGLTLLICSSGLFAQAGFIRGTVITNAGEEDTSFTITDPNDIQTMRNMLSNLPPASEPQWPQFGFRGYGLQNQGISSFPSNVHVFQGVIEIFDDFGSNFFVDQNGLEAFLGQKAGPTMAQLAVHQMLAENGVMPASTTQLPGPGPSPTATVTPAPSPSPSPDPSPTPAPTPLPKSGSEPPYEPGKWNKAGVIDDNNCYAYATNVMGTSFPRPGRAGGKQPPFPGQAGYNCANFIAAAESDGLVKADCDKACPNGSFKVALVINPDKDYHWYRQDDNGNWSHKPGSGKATDKDNSGKPILDPRKADRGPYTTFCSCFCVDPKKITIK
jgi:hypothetical protein